MNRREQASEQASFPARDARPKIIKVAASLRKSQTLGWRANWRPVARIWTFGSDPDVIPSVAPGVKVMVALNFKADFAMAIDGGTKTRTIRRVRKAGNPKRGDVMQLYTGMRTKDCEKIRDVTCTRIRTVLIDEMGVTLEGRGLYAGHSPAYLGRPDPDQYDGDFAHADGFESFGDMVEFFEKQYGLPFEGQLIEWSLSLPSQLSGGENG